ncbi:SURF1 family protein [Kribbella sp. NBC_00482]|uniref:SURF1 family protein n=1 Tax=Kribbella sp. NBC_00482 TaxID=2975968 RepID=UPI002E16B6D8
MPDPHDPAPADPASTSAPGSSARPLWRTVLTPQWSGLFVLALAIASVMTVMGVWQLGVYRSKTADATAQRAAEPPVELQSLFSIDEGLPAKAVGRRVTVDGTWGPAADQLLIADRLQDGRAGLWVVSPLKLSDTDAVMIVRGWVASTSDPAVTAPSGPVRLSGSVVASEAEDSSDDAAKGRVLSSLRIPTIVHLVKYRVYDAFVVQSAVDSGVVPSPAPAIVAPPPPPTDHAGLRNVAYAVQWWIFAAFTLWMWARMVLDARREPDEDATAGSGPDGSGTGDSETGDRAGEPVESSGTVSA